MISSTVYTIAVLISFFSGIAVGLAFFIYKKSKWDLTDFETLFEKGELDNLLILCQRAISYNELFSWSEDRLQKTELIIIRDKLAKHIFERAIKDAENNYR